MRRRITMILGGAALVALASGAASAGAQSGPATIASAAQEASGARDVNMVIAQEELRESERPASDLIPGWKPRKVVAVVDDAPGRAAWLQEVAPGVTVVPVRSQAEALAQVGDADGLINNTCNEEVMAQAKNLQWLQLMSAGIDYCLPYLEGRSGLVLTSLQRVQSNVLSDHVMAMLLALSRGIDLYARQDAAREFDRSRIPSNRMWQLRDRTLLIVGLGGVGIDVAAKAHAFGMRVFATRNSSHDGPDFVEYVGLADELPDLIGKADVVVITAPLTRETANLFDKTMFGRMKAGSIFINVSRGGIVVHDDLVAALKSGHLAAAGLDVTVPEPLPRDHPLFDTPNLLITPHVAGNASATEASREEGWRVVRENLRRYVAGEPLYNLVDLERGY